MLKTFRISLHCNSCCIVVLGEVIAENSTAANGKFFARLDPQQKLWNPIANTYDGKQIHVTEVQL